MRRLFRTAVTDAGRALGNEAADIAGLRIVDLAPTSAAGVATTKAGRLSMRGRTSDGRPVKLMGLFSPEHARAIAELSAGELSDLLPPVLGTKGSLVV